MKASYKIALLLSALIMGGSVVFWATKKKNPAATPGEPLTMTALTDTPAIGQPAGETALGGTGLGGTTPDNGAGLGGIAIAPTESPAPATALAGTSAGVVPAADPVAPVAASQPLPASFNAGQPAFPVAVAEGPLTAPVPTTTIVPQPAPAAPAADQEGVAGGIWTVKPGDLLGDIAKKVYGKSSAWQKIAAANPGINPNNVKVGTKLKLPAIEGATAAAPAPAPAPAPVGATQTVAAAPAPAPAPAPARTYTVKAGDSLSTIAQKFYGKQSEWKKIAEANPKVNPNALKLGAVLQIP